MVQQCSTEFQLNGTDNADIIGNHIWLLQYISFDSFSASITLFTYTLEESISAKLLLILVH